MLTSFYLSETLYTNAPLIKLPQWFWIRDNELFPFLYRCPIVWQQKKMLKIMQNMRLQWLLCARSELAMIDGKGPPAACQVTWSCLLFALCGRGLEAGMLNSPYLQPVMWLGLSTHFDRSDRKVPCRDSQRWFLYMCYIVLPAPWLQGPKKRFIDAAIIGT